MSVNTTQRSPIVFISYAHESEAFRMSVKNLSDWLATVGCVMITDHRYGYRPPEEGWQAWMHGSIERADIVLVVCSPRLKARYEKTEASGIGFGGTFEGAIVTQRIYDDAMRNTKFYPILPDGCSLEEVPTTLKPWWNRHYFPGGNEGIRRMIFDEPVSEEDASSSNNHQSSGSSQFFDHHHQVYAQKLLDASPLFYQALKQDFTQEYPDIPAPQSTYELVNYFAKCPTEQVQDLFYMVRRALRELSMTEIEPVLRKHVTEASAAMYCLAAIRLVIREANKAGNNIVLVPSSENVICAIIATALFGGKLRLLPAEVSGLPYPEYVFEVKVPAAGDQIMESFERAVYVALFQNSRAVNLTSLDSKPLNEQEIKALSARLRSIKNVERDCLALVIRGLADHRVSQPFADQYKVPVMFNSNAAASEILAMDAGDLLEEIREFWHELSALKPHIQTISSSEGDSNMPKSETKIEVHGGNVAVSIGDSSALGPLF